MSEAEEKTDSGEPAPETAPEPTAEDERRARAAESNRKRTEDQWNRNKQAWLKANFPEKTEAS